METRIIDGALSCVNTNFCDKLLIARICVNSKPAFCVGDLSRCFESEIPADVREKYVFEYVFEYGEGSFVEELVALEGALLWASRVSDGDKWVEHICMKVVPDAKKWCERFLKYRKGFRDTLANASAKI